MSTKHKVALSCGAVLAVLIAVLVFRATRPDRRGDLYAFSPKTGELQWHRRFAGVDPEVWITGGVLAVKASEFRCEPDAKVITLFDARTGRSVDADHPLTNHLPSLNFGPSLDISVNHGVVQARGRNWRAHVVDRRADIAPAIASRAGHVYVAVGGRWPDETCDG